MGGKKSQSFFIQWDTTIDKLLVIDPAGTHQNTSNVFCLLVELVLNKCFFFSVINPFGNEKTNKKKERKNGPMNDLNINQLSFHMIQSKCAVHPQATLYER